MKVADIAKGKLDPTGVEIDTVYSKVGEIYAVYRTAERIVIQYSDNDKLASEQRLALAPLNPLRGEINGLVDGWRTSAKSDKEAKARIFDRRVADALIVALQGDQPHALELLAGVKADILEERTSVARTEYLIVACVTAIGLIIVLSLAASGFLLRPADALTEPNSFWLAAAVGAVGALFSIALAIRSRSILTDLQSRDNAVDAVLRVMIGSVSAVILFALLSSNLVSFGFGGADISPTTMNMAIVVAFAAGFSERLVGDLLSQAVLSTNPLAGGASGQTSVAAGSASDANEKNPLGKPPADVASDGDVPDGGGGQPAMHEHDDDDFCIADIQKSSEELTHDVELPEASGGVEKP